MNWDIVTPGSNDEEKALNAKYAISIARMLGAVVFCVWEDIVAAKEKMILVFVCALNEVSKNKSHGLKSPVEEAKQYQAMAQKAWQHAELKTFLDEVAHVRSQKPSATLSTSAGQ